MLFNRYQERMTCSMKRLAKTINIYKTTCERHNSLIFPLTWTDFKYTLEKWHLYCSSDHSKSRRNLRKLQVNIFIVKNFLDVVSSLP